MEANEKSNKIGKRWTRDQEISFWEELKVAWERCCDHKAPSIELSGDSKDYFMILCHEAFRQKWEKCATQFTPLSAKEIWQELLVFFPKKDHYFIDFVIEGGIDYAIRKSRSSTPEITECFREIKGRLYTVIKTGFFRKWLESQMKWDSLDEKQEGGLSLGERCSAPISEDNAEMRELKDLGQLTADKIFLEEMINDCSRWAKRELLPGRAEKVTYLFGIRTLLSARSEELKVDLGAKRASTFYDVFKGQLRGIREHTRRLDNGLLDDEAQRIVAIAVTENLDRSCQKWFYSEKLNEGIFSCLPTRNNWKIDE